MLKKLLQDLGRQSPQKDTGFTLFKYGEIGSDIFFFMNGMELFLTELSKPLLLLYPQASRCRSSYCRRDFNFLF